MIYKYMSVAVAQAVKAALIGNVPVGAVIVCDDIIVAKSENGRGATSHAELNAINEALATTGGNNLNGCDIYVTLEPCPMCAGAILLSGIKNVYFGAYDSVYGACCSNDNLFAKNKNISKVTVCGGILEDECKALLTDFFKGKRKQQQ